MEGHGKDSESGTRVERNASIVHLDDFVSQRKPDAIPFCKVPVAATEERREDLPAVFGRNADAVVDDADNSQSVFVGNMYLADMVCGILAAVINQVAESHTQ